jgi:hypothetical protein
MATPRHLSLLSHSATLAGEALATDSLHRADTVSAIASRDTSGSTKSRHTLSWLKDLQDESGARIAERAGARAGKKRSLDGVITRGRAASSHSPYTFAMLLSRLKHMPSDAAEINTINHE